ncbi:Fur family transcriptional regulator [Pararhizobium polonicum]|jgi:Fur family ferric uptake transcriptional regulator|uniref:Ferric uptake regulation protein n=1 Tax=Pararhizobium polonicum TaxID=1612624 RepID=A0A1C7P233_9HYPH|nr:Fur family transcriptional regulator [Pararhizobium polonicum]OBZ95046.1 Fur family transcriptional regulator [Pararhizobium polonicum]
MTKKKTEIAEATATLERLCREKGLRMTGPRRIIAQVLASSDDHPDVVELHRRATAVDPGIAIATVYRTVKLLEENRIVERHAFGDGRGRFETVDQVHHDHLIDVDTGKVVEFHSEEIEKLQEEIARLHGYTIVSHRLEIFVKKLDKDGSARDPE